MTGNAGDADTGDTDSRDNDEGDSGTGASEASDELRMRVEHLQDLRRATSGDPQDHLIDPESAEVLELGVGGDRSEREYADQVRITSGPLEGTSELGQGLTES